MFARVSVTVMVWLLVGGTGVAQRPQKGDWVVVIAPQAELRIGKQVVGALPRGEFCTVNEVKDGWYWVRGDRDWAWIHSRDVIPRKEGVRYFSEAIRRLPTARDYEIRARLRSRERQHDLAIVDFNEAIRREPGNAEHYRQRALEWGFLNQLDNEIADFGEAIRLDAANYFLRAYRLEKKGQYDRAIADYDQVIRLDPKYPEALASRGRAWMHEGDFDRAIADFDEVLRGDSKKAPDVFVYVNRAEAHLRKGDVERAMRDFDEAIRRTADNPWSYEYPRFVRANAWLSLHRYDRALADCEEISRFNSKQPMAYAMAAWIRAACPDAKYRDGAAALKAATQAVEFWGALVGADEYAILAAANAELGRFDKAKQWQSKAIESAPENDKDLFRKALEAYDSGTPLSEKQDLDALRPAFRFKWFVQ